MIDLNISPMECHNLIDGKWKLGQGEKHKVYSPYNGAEIGSYQDSTDDDVANAIDKASKAQKTWAATPLKERCAAMFRLREILLKKCDEISLVVALESGKTFGEAKAGLLKGVEVLEYALSLQNIDQGAKMQVSRGVFCEYRREPIGVVANITPFNFPAMVPMWTLPIVITLGNAYVWKPSEKVPLTSQLLGKCFLEAGIPNGVLTILHGSALTVNSIIENPSVKAVGFVGSSKVAKLVFEKSAKHGKRSLAMGGAKNHIVLLPDAELDMTGRGISDSFTGCAGQRCMAASVVLAVGDSQKQIDAIVERAKACALGEGMGAIITKEQLEFLHQAIDQAEADGAKVLLDGRKVSPPQGCEGGNWFGPTILDHVKPTMQAATHELFGPIISIIRCDSISSAMEIENKCEYGNACSVFTSSGALAEKVIQSASAGMVGVNIGVPVPREPFSFGGIGTSKFGHGEITGEGSLSIWSNLKKVTTKWEEQNDQNWMN